MNKREKGQERTVKLEAIIKEVLAQDDKTLTELQNSGLLKKSGEFIRKALAEAVGLDCIPDTFRQNLKMKDMLKEAEKTINERICLNDPITESTEKTKVAIGKDNENQFLKWLLFVGTEELPVPKSFTGRLYKKGLWALYSKQQLLDIKQLPTWFYSRPKVKKALDVLDVKVVQKKVITQKMESESIADDMENTMTSALVRKLRAENKKLQEKLDAEIEARKLADLQFKQLGKQVSSGKMARR